MHSLGFALCKVVSPRNRGLCRCPYPLPAPLQLEKMYPDMLMKFRLSASSAPFLNIGPGGLSLKPVVDIQAYAILPNSSLAPLFLLSLVSSGTASGGDCGPGWAAASAATALADAVRPVSSLLHLSRAKMGV